MADLFGAGLNDNYQLAQGDTTNRNALTQISGDWLILSAGYSTQYFVVGIKTDGTLWSWGMNTYGQLGQGDTSVRNTPTQIGSDTWIDVVCGYAHVVGIKTDGTLWAWGKNDFAQCGLGHTTTPVTAPTQIGSATDWTSVKSGTNTSFAGKADHSWQGWGSNNVYQLGLGHFTSPQTTPTAITGNYVVFSTRGACALAIKSDGTLWGWGYQTDGMLGNNSTSGYIVPTQIGSATDWAFVDAGYNHSYAIKTDGTLYAAGLNANGQLGLGDTTRRLTFTQIGSGNQWVSAKGLSLSGAFLNAAGELWATGNNTYGQLGIANNDNQLSPVQSPFATALDTLYGSDLTLYAAAAAVPLTTVSAPISISVDYPSGTVSAPLRVAVASSGTAAAAINIIVDSIDQTTQWSLALTIGATSYAPRLTGVLHIDAEEGAARTATFSLLPESGAIDPSTWLDDYVYISLVRIVDGLTVSTLIFRGQVDSAALDMIAQRVDFTCSDNLKSRIAALSREQIDRLTMNSQLLDYSPAALGPLSTDLWQYAQARMECVNGMLDLSVQGNARVTPFAGLISLGTYTAGQVLDESLSLELPQRGDIINRVNIEYAYRLYRCRERNAAISWANSIASGTDSYASGYQSPSIDAVKSAVDGCGWHVHSASYLPGYQYVKTSAPAGYPENNDWWVYATPNPCGQMIASLGQRHAQPFTENYAIRIDAHDSQATYGVQETTLRGALATEWDPQFWESDFTLTTPDASSGDIDYAGAQTRQMSNDAIATLLLMAQRRILASHRSCRVRFAIPCNPHIDLIHRAGIDTPRITATGKVARYEHVIDIDAGSADTYITLAVLGVGAWGGGQTNDVNDTPPDPPAWGPGQHDATTWVTQDWEAELPNLSRHVGGIANHAWDETYTGFLVNAPAQLTVINFTTDDYVSVDNPYYAAGWDYPQTGYKIVMPGVADNYRQAPAIDTISEARGCAVATTNPLTLIIGA